jgi:hypothetical protein
MARLERLTVQVAPDVRAEIESAASKTPAASPRWPQFVAARLWSAAWAVAVLHDKAGVQILTTIADWGLRPYVASMARGIFRTVDGLVQVDFGIRSVAMYRKRYEEEGYQPPFETLPSEADYWAAQEKEGVPKSDPLM